MKSSVFSSFELIFPFDLKPQVKILLPMMGLNWKNGDIGIYILRISLVKSKIRGYIELPNESCLKGRDND